MENLTEKEQKILEGISTFIEEKGYPPSQRELAHKVGLKSPNTVDYHLKNMEKKGVIKCSPNRFRAIELKLKEPTGHMIRIPILGMVPAGSPMTAVQQHDDYLDLDKSLAGAPQTFGLRVKGDSMINAGILEGDIVLVRMQSDAQNGDIVVARFNDEATVKYLRRKRDSIFLEPANEKYKPIPASEAQIVGKVTGVIRRYH